MKNNPDVGFLIKLVHDCVQKEANLQLKQNDLTLSQARLLAYLYENNGVTMQKELEKVFDVSHPTVAGLIKRMETKNLIFCKPDEQNKTLKNIALTEKGISFYHVTVNQRNTTEKKLLSGLSKEEVTQLKKLLQTIYLNIQNQQDF